MKQLTQTSWGYGVMSMPAQVYRATLTQQYGGGDVAVKVQRPKVRQSVALDLLLMRQAAAFAQRFPQVSATVRGAPEVMGFRVPLGQVNTRIGTCPLQVMQTRQC